MTTYYVFTNGTHTTAIDGDVLDIDCDAANEMAELEAAAKAAAREKFETAGLRSDVKLLKVLDGEDLPEDEAEDLGVSEAVFLAIANERFESDDCSVDADAEISGFNARALSGADGASAWL